MAAPTSDYIPGPPPLLHGRYRLTRQLGSGGMGWVYQAQDELLDRLVALKFLAPDQVTNSTRFLREAQVVAGLTHPHIVTLFDAGKADGWHYLILEFVPGQTLAQLLQKRNHALSVTEAVDLIRPLLAALAYAHARGVIHRDIKPQNIMVTPNGRVKLTDFGLALATEQTRLTTNSGLMGTPLYLAPECIQGQPASPQSDLYAVGVVLYELLTGKPPFQGQNTASTLIEILNTAVPPPSVSQAGIPAHLEDLVLQLLAKEPAQRPESAQAVLETLAGSAPAIPAPTGAAPLPADTAVILESERQRLAALLQAQIVEPVNLLLAQAGLYEQTFANNAPARTAVSVLTALARQVLQQARDLETNLHPALLASLGLEAALEALANQTSRASGVQMTLHLTRLPDRLPSALELALYRATQDVLAAAIDLGQATQISLQLHSDPHRLTYLIEDNRLTAVPDALSPATSQQLATAGATVTMEQAHGRTQTIIRLEQAPDVALTPREMDVIQCLAAGLSNKEIALKLTIKPRTVNFHLDNIYAKLGVSSRTEAAVIAMRRGWLPPPG